MLGWQQVFDENIVPATFVVVHIGASKSVIINIFLFRKNEEEEKMAKRCSEQFSETILMVHHHH